MADRFRLSPSRCCCTVRYCVTVYRCYGLSGIAPTSGATVTLTPSGGGAALEAETDESGVACFDGLTPGDYSLDVAYDPWAPYSGTVAVGAAGGSTSVNVVPPAGLVCACCESSLMPDTLHITTKYGTYTLTYGLHGLPSWGMDPVGAYEPTALAEVITSCPGHDWHPDGNAIVVIYSVRCDGDAWVVRKGSSRAREHTWTRINYILGCVETDGDWYLSPGPLDGGPSDAEAVFDEGPATLDPCGPISFVADIPEGDTHGFGEEVTVSE